MKKILISVLLVPFVFCGCGKTLDNADFIPDFEYTEDSPSDTDEDVEPDVLEDNQIKVISFNVRVGTGDTGTANAWDLRKKAIPPLLTKENPTVFGVQEALIAQMDYINSELPEYSYIGVGRDDGDKSGEFMGIFYKKDDVTLGKNGTFWLSTTPEKPSYGWDAGYRRTVTWAFFTVRKTGKQFFYMNTHLDNEGKLARQNSILLICDKLAELNPDGVPSILTADFNSATGDAIFDPLKQIMFDARATAAKTDNLSTFNGWGSSSGIIDHIFYSGFKAVEYKTIQDRYAGVTYASDHYPVHAILEFQ